MALGFEKETIQYLSADTDLHLDQNGLFDDVDADTTIAARAIVVQFKPLAHQHEATATG